MRASVPRTTTARSAGKTRTIRSPDRVNIYEIMEKPLICIDPETNIRYCARLFERYRLNRAAVIEAREVIGIVSYADIVIKGMKQMLDAS